MYRPKGWKKTKLKFMMCPTKGNGCKTCPTTIDKCSYDFEFGASAMLEGLETGDYFIRVTDKAVTMPGFLATVEDTVRGAGDGLWVFILEEKE